MSSFSHLKQTVYSSYSGVNSTDMMSSMRQILQYGTTRPLLFVAGTSFVCFALLPVLAFLGFALGTLVFTLIAALAWEIFLIICGSIVLAMALAVALTLAGCCTGIASIIYISLTTLHSSFQWVASTPLPYRRTPEDTTRIPTSTDKED